MKKSLITTLVAVPLLSLSSMAFAAEPVLLTAAEMDGVTAGTYSWVENFAFVNQINVSPVTVVQVSVLNANVGGGGDGAGNNTALISSGNFAWISQ
jgi:hypothetical protein